MSVADLACLHCEQTRAEIKANDTICGIEGGYETVELVEEWSRHRWADWSDKDLTRFGILPEAFERHRRTPITVMQYVACEDTVRGHIAAGERLADLGFRADECVNCGHRPTVTTR